MNDMYEVWVPADEIRPAQLMSVEDSLQDAQIAWQGLKDFGFEPWIHEPYTRSYPVLPENELDI